jgi:hypothetical protein
METIGSSDEKFGPIIWEHNVFNGCYKFHKYWKLFQSFLEYIWIFLTFNMYILLAQIYSNITPYEINEFDFF